MIKRLRLFATLRDVAHAKEITVPFEGGQTVRDLIAAINSAHPVLGSKILDGSGTLTGAVRILVDGRNIDWLNGLDTVIGEQDEVVLMPPSAGG